MDSSVKDIVIASSQIICLLSEVQRRYTYNRHSFLLFLLFRSMAPTSSTKHAAALAFRSMRNERGETFLSASPRELTISP